MKAENESWRPMAWRSAVCLVAALAGWGIHDRSHNASSACYMVAFLFGGWDLTRQVWDDLRQLRFDTHFLMLLVVPGSVAVGAWGEAALLLILFSASAAMEAFAAGRTRREIDALLQRAPKTARLRRDGHDVEVPVASLVPGDLVRVTANEQVPVDVELVSGESACDESNLTGESVPVPKRTGDAALSGTLNLWGVFEGRVLRPASDSALQRIVRLIESAQHLKAPVQRFTDRFGTGYTASVLVGCLGVFLFTWLVTQRPAFLSTDGVPSAFYRAMTLLVVLSPCALVLSVPSAILSAIACGARHGVLFRGGAAVENLATINLVAMDKTGTLTEGNLQVTSLEILAGSDADLRAAAGNLARLSNHPVSRSLAREANHAGLAQEIVSDSETIAGRGVRGRWRDRRVSLGHRDLVADSGAGSTALPPPPEEGGEVWVAGEGLLGRFLVRDELRPESRSLIAQLHARGLQTVMLTGDRAAAARRIAAESGVGEVRSELRPEDKVAALTEFRAKGLHVAMIGDGVNDAPCLAAADVGVAMGARGSDAAIEQAEVVLMHDRLENFLLARELSHRAVAIIRQNLVLSLGTMLGMAVLTLLQSRLPLWIGVAAHEGSTALVVLNSLRLLRTPSRS
jgi:Cd2+/Zn2+-exporting ATPase